jgi:hypothetical protein
LNIPRQSPDVSVENATMKRIVLGLVTALLGTMSYVAIGMALASID